MRNPAGNPSRSGRAGAASKDGSCDVSKREDSVDTNDPNETKDPGTRVDVVNGYECNRQTIRARAKRSDRAKIISRDG